MNDVKKVDPVKLFLDTFIGVASDQHSKFVNSKLTINANKNAYLEAGVIIIKEAQHQSHNLERLKRTLLAIEQEFLELKDKWYSIGRPKKYKLLAIHQALDIIYQIEMRYVN